MDVIFDWLPESVAHSLRAQSPETLALAGGLVLVAIVLAFHALRR